MIREKTWNEFQSSGLFWWVNRMIHIFGWVLVYERTIDGEVIRVFPARSSFRGFKEETEEEGFKMLTNHLSETIIELKEEANG